jgi:hypothetical protein
MELVRFQVNNSVRDLLRDIVLRLHIACVACCVVRVAWCVLCVACCMLRVLRVPVLYVARIECACVACCVLRGMLRVTCMRVFFTTSYCEE